LRRPLAHFVLFATVINPNLKWQNALEGNGRHSKPFRFAFCYESPQGRFVAEDLPPEGIGMASGAFCSLFFFHQPHPGMTKCSGKQ